MRVRKNKNGISVNAIAGTYVVFFGLDLDKNFRNSFRGFAIRRKDHADGEIVWLRGVKTFEKTEPHPALGETFSTFQHPIQSFQWADYSAKAGFTYTYTIIGLYGDPSSLENRREVELTITTELETGPVHSAFFNRGSVATQEYARRFLNQIPAVAGPGAYEWLSRGLVEALIAFLGRAKAGNSIHGAVYEFQFPAVLDAIKQAHDRGAIVHIRYDDVEKLNSDQEATGPWEKNREAIAKAKIKGICKGRKQAKLMHNKFFVLSNGDTPVAVWTGSTNITENGIFGHSNVGQIVEDTTVAQAYRDYWDRLAEDPAIDQEYRDANMEATPVPQAVPLGTTVIFSPRRTQLDALEWYAQIARAATGGLFMTFAFGMHEKFKNVFSQDDQILKMALMEKAFASPSVKERDVQDIQNIRNLPNVVVALGNRIVTNAFDRWLKEMYSVDGKGKHVYWIHTKYMIVDPLGNEPIVISGSANFSKASTDTNDENMMVIKGDKRIADIYFGEYMRLFAHYSFRESVKRALEKQEAGNPEEWRPQYLIDDDAWTKDYYTENDKGARCLRRVYFSGPMSI